MMGAQVQSTMKQRGFTFKSEKKPMPRMLKRMTTVPQRDIDAGMGIQRRDFGMQRFNLTAGKHDISQQRARLSARANTVKLSDLKQQEAKQEESTPSPVKPVNRENFKQNILSALVGSRAKPNRQANKGVNVVEPEVPTSPSALTTQNNEEKINFNPPVGNQRSSELQHQNLISYRHSFKQKARSSSFIDSSVLDQSANALIGSVERRETEERSNDMDFSLKVKAMQNNG